MTETYNMKRLSGKLLEVEGDDIFALHKKRFSLIYQWIKTGHINLQEAYYLTILNDKVAEELTSDEE